MTLTQHSTLADLERVMKTFPEPKSLHLHQSDVAWVAEYRTRHTIFASTGASLSEAINGLLKRLRSVQ